MMGMKNNLIKCLFLVLFVFFSAELLSRLIININPYYERYIKNISDSGMRLECIRKCNVRSKRSSFESCFVYHPTRGWALRPSIKNKIFFDNKILNTNSKGVRGKIEYSYKKDPKRTRILVLGDSFTFGEEVSDTETYPYYLQQMLPNAEIINLGVPTYGHDQMLIYWHEEGWKYHPDIVLLGYGSWDNVRNLSEYFFRSKPRFCWSRNQLVIHNSSVHSLQWFLKQDFWESRFFDLIEILNYDLLKRIGVIDQEAEVITNHILDNIVYSVRNNNTKIAFIYLSNMFTYIPPSLKSFPVKMKFIETWKNKGVPCIFIKPFPFSEAKNGLLREHHYAPFVNERIAQGIKEFLLNNNLVK
jgi:hypothetical protein